MPIARFVTAKDIQRIHNERNPDNPIGYGMACTIKQTCREKYEKEFGKVKLYGEVSAGMFRLSIPGIDNQTCNNQKHVIC